MDVLQLLPHLIRVRQVPIVSATFLPEPERSFTGAFIDRESFDRSRINLKQSLLDLVRTRPLDPKEQRSDLAI